MCNEEKILETIRVSKSAFYEHEARQRIHAVEFLFLQSRYIQKRWLVMQAGLLVIVWLMMKNYFFDHSVYRLMGAAAPLFAVLLIPELWKNRMVGAMEVESSTLFSLRQIYTARMLICAGADLLFVTVFIAVMFVRFSLWELAVHFLLPLVVAACLCFRTLYSLRFGSEVLAIMLCTLWSAVWSYIVLNEAVYTVISERVWLAALMGSGIYLAYCVFRGQTQWNKIWETKPLWN